jgi:TPR repeat protein
MIAAGNYLFAAAQGHPGAQYHFGMCLLNGQGIGTNIEEAALQFRKSAAQNHSKGQYRDGLQLFRINDIEAAGLIQLSADNGFPDA